MQKLMMVAALVLAACDAGPVSGSRDSGAYRLEVGMSVADVARTIGRAQQQQAIPSQPGRICYSYLYDESINARYVHVVFESGLLVAASDRHRHPCNPT